MNESKQSELSQVIEALEYVLKSQDELLARFGNAVCRFGSLEARKEADVASNLNKGPQEDNQLRRFSNAVETLKSERDKFEYLLSNLERLV